MNIFGVPIEQHALALIISFIAVGLRGFQQKNVNGDHIKLVFFTSYAITGMEMVSIGLVVHNGWAIAVPAATGAAFGMVFSMWLHQRLLPPDQCAGCKIHPNIRIQAQTGNGYVFAELHDVTARYIVGHLVYVQHTGGLYLCIEDIKKGARIPITDTRYWIKYQPLEE